MVYTKERAQQLLPKIGEQRWETPTIDDTSGHTGARAPQRCVVVDVRPEQLWYVVQFENGIRECYKVPRLRSAGGGGRV